MVIHAGSRETRRIFARRFPLRRTAILLATAGAAGCSDSSDILRPPEPASPIFATYVAMGNSITAGFQSAGINDSTQRESYAALLAGAMRTRYAYASLAMPGCPPPLTRIDGTRVGGETSTGQTCALRQALSPTLNNVAVPLAASDDPTSATTSRSTFLTQLILGGKTQVQKALDAHPTFVSIWIGNNDVLEAGTSGVLEPTPGVSRGLTPVETFAANYDAMLDQLASGATPGLAGVLIGVVDVTNVPHLFPAAALLDPAFKTAFDGYVGRPTTVLANCVGSASKVSFRIIAFLADNPNDPAIISCEKDAPTGLGDAFILDTGEQALITDAVNSYNAHIAARAQALGWAFVDPNAILVAARNAGLISPSPNLADPEKAFGEYMSLDGVHPTRGGHVLVANAVIDAINATYGTTLAHVS